MQMKNQSMLCIFAIALLPVNAGACLVRGFGDQVKAAMESAGGTACTQASVAPPLRCRKRVTP